jgi:hypothetical protein
MSQNPVSERIERTLHGGWRLYAFALGFAAGVVAAYTALAN